MKKNKNVLKINHEEVEINSAFVMSMLHSKSNEYGITSLLNEQPTDTKSATGKWDLYDYKDMAVVGIKDLQILSNFTTHSNLEEIISIEIILSGGSDIQLGSTPIKNNDMPKLIVASHCKESKQSRYHMASEAYKGVGIWINPSQFHHEFNIEVADYALPVAELLQVKFNRSLVFPITRTIKSIAADLIHNSFCGKTKKIYLEAKTSELICHIIEHLKEPGKYLNLDNQLTALKTKAMKRVLLRLNQDLGINLCLDELASEACMSKSQLTQTFKSCYGLNISEYVTQQKLLKASELIMGGKLSVLEVALEVGYKDQSSFGRAYKKFFGCSPLKSKNNIQ